MSNPHRVVRRAGSVRRYAGLVIGTILAACSGGGGVTNGTPNGPGNPTLVLTTVVVSLSSASIAVGLTATASATGLDQNGAAIAVGSVAWTSGSTSVATVSATGIVSGIAPGQAVIVATSGTKFGQQVITVTAVPVATVTVAPPTATVAIGGTQQLTATTLDALGTVLAGRTITWSTSDANAVSVSPTGLATGVASGSATITASSEGKSGTSVVTVTSVPVATVSVTPSTMSLAAGATQGATAAAFDAGGNVLQGKVFTWTTSNGAVATVASSGSAATITGVAPGSATVTATSEGRSGSTQVTVTVAAAACTGGTALQLAAGEIRTLTAAQVASLCLGGLASASEYALIPFSRSPTAAATLQLEITGTNAGATIASPLASQGVLPGVELAAVQRARLRVAGEAAFRERERAEMTPAYARLRASRSGGVPVGPEGPRALTASPVVGQVISLNSNGLQGCGNAIVKSARIAAVTAHAVIMIETTAPAGGYTDAELTAFGTQFDNQVYNLDVATFGAPTDIDGNGRIGIFFTTGVNVETTNPSLGVVGGFFFGRDLLPVAQCAGSNFGEMFYMPVPDPNATINGSYTSKAVLTEDVPGTLAHEFQHLINAGRRLYVNAGAAPVEEVWLNEGLSHIAEELLYYQQSGASPRSNIGLTFLFSSQAQLNLFNQYAAGDFGLLISYLFAPSSNSPYAQSGSIETRGATWQFLRYAADRKGGNEQAGWFSLVNSLSTGKTNFEAVFGDVVAMTHDWAIAQFTDDAGLGVAANFTHPSWNFRSILPAFFQPQHHPLATVSLASGTPQAFTLAGGGAAYVRFRVAAGALATVVSTSSGQPVPATVDFILIRSQ